MTNYTKEFIYKFKNTCLENPFERSIEFYIPISKEKLVPSKNAWKSKIPRTEYDIIIKKVKGILNKISIDNFDKLSNDLYELKLSTQELVKDTIIIIVDKSINEPTFGDIYANLCLKLSKKNYNVDEKIFNFRNELVNQCQFKFEKEENFKKSIGNIKFIGELFNKDLLPSNVMIRQKV
jgi:translation initiation factor 4G